MMRDFPHNSRSMHNIQTLREATTVNDIARSMPRISVALENQQVDHQSIMLEIEGKISNQIVSILIDPGATLIYVSPQTIEIFRLKT